MNLKLSFLATTTLSGGSMSGQDVDKLAQKIAVVGEAVPPNSYVIGFFLSCIALLVAYIVRNFLKQVSEKKNSAVSDGGGTSGALSAMADSQKNFMGKMAESVNDIDEISEKVSSCMESLKEEIRELHSNNALTFKDICHSQDTMNQTVIRIERSLEEVKRTNSSLILGLQVLASSFGHKYDGEVRP